MKPKHMSLKTTGVAYVSNSYLHGKSEHNPCEYLIDRLNSADYEVKKFVVTSEDVHALIADLDLLYKQCDFIIVVSNLNDGVPLKALSKLSGQDLKLNDDLEDILKSFQESSCKIPVNARILKGPPGIYPVIHMQRIFLLREHVIQQQFENILYSHLQQYRENILFRKKIKLPICEINQKELESIVGECDALIETDEKGKTAELTVQSTNFDVFVENEKLLKEKLPHNRGDVEVFDLTIYCELVYKSRESHVRQAVKYIEDCLEEYGPENIFLSFNGGKDCTVLLHLVHTVLRHKYPTYRNPILCLYVSSKSPFVEQDNFIALCETYYNLNVIHITSGIKDALQDILKLNPNLKACFMGTRRTDPFSKELKVFQMTDTDWPQIMRISPLLDWHYSDIWDYILFYKVPYCKLYDLGYTSLGNALNTVKNPSLCNVNFEETKIYLPAYKLLNESKERHGRNVLI